jgi:hypothetical protein
MKSRALLVCAVVILLPLIHVVGWAQEKYVPKPDEELYGTWTNEKAFPPRLVESPDGTFAEFFPISNPKPFRGGTTEIVKKWTGSDGSVYYYLLKTVTLGVNKGMRVQFLHKISESGKVLETAWRSGTTTFDAERMPTEIDPKDQNYQIFNMSGS